MIKMRIMLTTTMTFALSSCVTQSFAPIEQCNSTYQEGGSNAGNHDKGKIKEQKMDIVYNTPSEISERDWETRKHDNTVDKNSAQAEEVNIEHNIEEDIDRLNNKVILKKEHQEIKNATQDHVVADTTNAANKVDTIKSQNPPASDNTIAPVSLSMQEDAENLPVSGGKVIKKFGEIEDGNRLQGINISTNLGADVTSVCEGDVIHAGNSPKFGNLLIIKAHNDNTFVAYAYLKKLLVNVGDKVNSGQVLGNVGYKTNSQVPMLHFAVRKGKMPIDPLPFLAKSLEH